MNSAVWRCAALLLCAAQVAACTPDRPEVGGAASSMPQRVVTLAPHLAELMFAAGAGERLVGVSAYTDYPAAVRDLPLVGDAFIVDQEQLSLLEPDLLLAWQSGTPEHVVDELRMLGYRVEVIRTRGLHDVAAAIERIGRLTGTAGAAEAAAARFRAGIGSLREQSAGAEPIRVFYQVSGRPLYTVNGDHFVSELIALCGGRNVFAALRELAPLITEEAVLSRDPEVLLAAGVPGEAAFASWARWRSLAANRYANHFLIEADIIGRATPRLLQAGDAVCAALQQGRRRRAAAAASQDRAEAP